ncbi:MAG TPA: amidohydrolase family protein [Burkholderiales bacterium]|nr:amidohydrolase family protein [Burkholderiales bacterium]
MNLGFPLADAHLHFWDPRTHYYPWLCDPAPIAFRYGDYQALRRPYLPPDYRKDAEQWDVRRTVYVEAEWEPRDPAGEMDFIAGLRGEHGMPSVAVAQAWLDRDDCPAVLDAHAERSFVRGVRHKPRPGQMDDARWRTGYARLAGLGLHFELQTPWQELAAAARLADDFPDTTIVLNHAGLPLPGELDAWQAAMAGLARCANAAVKISGLGNLDAPRKARVIATLLEFFGMRRAMFASNYPVDGLRASYDAIYGLFDDATRGLSSAVRRDLFHDNAVRIYRME